MTPDNIIYDAEYDIYQGNEKIGFAIEEGKVNDKFIMPMFDNDFRAFIHLCRKVPITYEKDKDNKSFESSLMLIEAYSTESKNLLASLNEPFVLQHDFKKDNDLVYNKNILIPLNKNKIELGIRYYNILICYHCREKFEWVCEAETCIRKYKQRPPKNRRLVVELIDL